MTDDERPRQEDYTDPIAYAKALKRWGQHRIKPPSKMHSEDHKEYMKRYMRWYRDQEK